VITIALTIGGYFGLKNEVELKGYEGNAFLFAILTIGVIASLIIHKRRGFTKAIIALFFFYTLFNLVFFNYLYPTVYKNNPLSKTMNEFKKYDKVVAYKIFHPSFTYYLPERVKVFENADSLHAYLKTNEALVLSRQALVPEIDSLKLETVAAHHDLFEDHTTVLLTNKRK
jgi:hypothetical protein